MRTNDEVKDITLLGQKNVKYDFDYRPDVLETFDNKHIDHDYWVKFNCPEFTTLCPITGQPDFGTVYINCTCSASEITAISMKTLSTLL